ncbi:SRPBCC domain-containing protein [Sphingomonas sp. AOB5]|uniref:SRPBCC domain-containing protein n=1 Tax=Sphingomonas sp. AOB5 TaxID=3034017 RepID=UPI0023FA4254|nr:SRPBCC domain-containing protein [Sphingomonas sp. AOB5]MDF7775316.1 SRPBCC domain-containing protein [Sphingomonas sp. AOB5]
MTDETGRKRTDTAFREIAATPRAIYAALTDSDAMAQWLPPEGMTGRIEAFDLRTGGAYRMVLTYSDGPDDAAKSSEDSDIAEGVFVELVPGVRMVQRVEFASDDPAFAGAMTITWRLDPLEDGTRVTVTAQDVPVGIRKKDHLDGLRSTLANLAAFVSG